MTTAAVAIPGAAADSAPFKPCAESPAAMNASGSGGYDGSRSATTAPSIHDGSRVDAPPVRWACYRLLMKRTVAVLLVALLSACGGDSEPERCVGDYGFQVDGDACDENGNSRDECPGVTCSCGTGTSQTSYICFSGTCVTAIDDCEAWCAASTDEQFECS